MRAVLFLFMMSSLLAAPVPRPEQVPNLVGTKWQGFDHDVVTTYEFFADGTMSWTHERGSWKDATWKLEGTTLTWTFNNYSHFEGTVVGDRFNGKRWNKVGLKWELSAQRLP